jgi:hypothetical protein
MCIISFPKWDELWATKHLDALSKWNYHEKKVMERAQDIRERRSFRYELTIDKRTKEDREHYQKAVKESKESHKPIVISVQKLVEEKKRKKESETKKSVTFHLKSEEKSKKQKIDNNSAYDTTLQMYGISTAAAEEEEFS